MQHTHNSSPFSQRSFPVVILCDQIKSPANIGGLFRISDAFGVGELVFFGTEIDFNSTRLKRTARNTLSAISYRLENSLSQTIDQYREQGFIVIGLEITQGSQPLQTIELDPTAKVALVLGNEKHGISEEIISKLDACYHVEMYGQNSSMNVIQAASIGLYAITNKLISNE